MKRETLVRFKCVFTSLTLSVVSFSAYGVEYERQERDSSRHRIELTAVEKSVEVSTGRYRVGEIKIFHSGEAGSPGPIQTLTVVMESEHGNAMLEHFGYSQEDINFDGHPDVAVFEHGGAKWRRFHWWLYEPGSGKYVRTKLTEELGALAFAQWELNRETGTIQLQNIWDGKLVARVFRPEGHELVQVSGPRRWTDVR